MNWRAALDRVRALAGALDRDGALARACALAHDRNLNLDLASALAVARTLASALELDRIHVLDQARDLAGSLVRDLANALDSEYTVHRGLALDRAAAAARKLAQALDFTHIVIDGDYAPGRAAGPNPDLSRDLASALASYHALLRALASYPDLARDRDLSNPFALYCAVAQVLAHHLDRDSATVDADGAVEVAVQLLPHSWQSRYREEYRAELAELPPGERNEYARRVLTDALELRKELETECPPDRARAKE